MTSVRARLLIGWMRLHRNDRFYAEPAVMRSRLPQHRSADRSHPLRGMLRTHAATRRIVDGRAVHTITPAAGPTSPRHNWVSTR